MCAVFRRVSHTWATSSLKEVLRTDPSKVERVCEWPVPENATEVKSFLGLASLLSTFLFLTLLKWPSLFTD